MSTTGLRSSMLRHQVMLQQLGTRVDDGSAGGPIPFEDVREVWAYIEPLEGSELLNSGQLETTLTHRIRIRFVEGVRPNWRIVYGERLFDIDRVVDVEERHRELELMCTEQVTW